MTIHLTDAAVAEIKRMQRSRQQPDSFFCLGVSRGGCQGFYYTLALSETIREGDWRYDSQGIAILVDTQSTPYLQDLTLDYAEDLMGGGFRFDNAAAVKTCSCGLSFDIKDA